jgi:O-antigen/teichoic acid export membrane protein
MTIDPGPVTMTATLPSRARHVRPEAVNVVPVSKRATASKQRVMFLTVVDQGMSSVSNFALAIIIAHYSDAHVLGVFAVLTTTYILSQGLVRSLTSDCLLTRHETDDTVMARFEQAGFLSAIAYSVALSVLLAAVGFLLSPEFRLTFLIFAAAFPLMACQDYARYIGISRYNPLYAIYLDLVWLLVFVGAYVDLRHAGLTTLPWIFGAWAASGAVVGLYALWNHAARHRFRGLFRFWYDSERHVGVRFAGQTLLVTSWTYVIVYLFILVFSVAVIGQFKLAQLAFGPIAVMGAGILTAMIALAAKAFQVDTRRAMRFVLLGGLATAAVTVVWMLALYFAPLHAMTKALGPAWPAARRLVPFIGLSFALSTISGAATSGLRAIRAAKENLRLALVMVPLLFVCCMGGALLWGIEAAAAGLCVGFVIYAAAGWTLLVRAVHRFTPGAGGESEALDPVMEVAEP